MTLGDDKGTEAYSYGSSVKYAVDSAVKHMEEYSFDAYGDSRDVIFIVDELEGLQDVIGLRNELAHLSSNGELLETTIDDLRPFVGTYLHPKES